MVYEVSDLMIEVRTALDMNTSSAALLAEDDVDTLSLDDIIRSKLARAARVVEESAPRHLLDYGKVIGDTINWHGEIGKGSGMMKLPDDFMRLISFQMDDWERPVTEAVDEDSAEYRKQKSRYAGIRGTPQRPVVAIVQRPTGQYLEFYSCVKGEDVKLLRARYLPYPKIGADGGIEICEKLKDAVVHYTAYLTALTFGEQELAAAVKSIAEELMT